MRCADEEDLLPLLLHLLLAWLHHSHYALVLVLVRVGGCVVLGLGRRRDVLWKHHEGILLEHVLHR